MPRTPKQYIHTGQPDQWCRLTTDGVVECASPLNEFGLYHFDDIEMQQKHILNLHEKCEKWSKDE